MLKPNWRFPERASARGAIGAFLAFLFLSGGISLAQEPPPQSGEFVQRPEEELLLLQVVLGRDILTPTLPAFPTPGGIVVPLGEMARLLSLAIEADVVRGTAEGFVISEDRGFRLDARAGTVTVAGKR